MITEENYLNAKTIVEAYKEQLKQENIKLNEERKLKQKKKEAECGEHYFISDGKWTSTRTCQDCGKTIGN